MSLTSGITIWFALIINHVAIILWPKFRPPKETFLLKET